MIYKLIVLTYGASYTMWAHNPEEANQIFTNLYPDIKDFLILEYGAVPEETDLATYQQLSAKYLPFQIKDILWAVYKAAEEE